MSFGRAATPQDFGIEWNAENQLTRVTKDAVEVARFAYDPLGRRVEKVAGTTATAYAYANEDILREGSAGATLRYVHDAGVDEPLAVGSDSGGWTFVHADALNSEIKRTDEAGGVVASRTYEAFGQPQLGEATAGYSFSGREWDPEVRLEYFRARYYDPRTGRFVSEDPLGVGGTLQLYRYAGGNPVAFLDPFGTYRCYYYTANHTMVCEPDQAGHPMWITDNVTSGMNGPELIDPATGRSYSECSDCPNNPRRANRAGRGPIPEGDYNVGRQGANPRRPTWRPLTPRKSIPRPGFYTHFCPNPATCSEGCVAFTDWDDFLEFNRLMNLEPRNRMIVRPEGSRHRCESCP